ncbi:MAG TPA: PfkB family carbohydrate kinase, partial [Herpetosiphonaceae bacterium]
MARIICYGSLAVDRLIRLPRWIVPGDDLHALQEADYAGGTALNVGLTLHGWGHEVLVGGNVLGEDWAARLIDRRLGELGLDRRWLARSPERNTVTCTILVTPEGERTIIGHAFGVAQAGPLPPLEGAAALSIDNYGPGRIAIARQAKAAGLLVSASDVHELDHPMLPLLDLVTYSRALAERELGGGELDGWAAAVAGAGPRWIAITDGEGPGRLW